MRYAWALLAVGWVVYLIVFVLITLAGIDVRGPFQLLGDVL